MSLGEKIRARTNEAAVKVQSGAAADTIIDRAARRQQAPYGFNAGPAPKGMTAEEYSWRVGHRAIEIVERRIDPPVEYDHELSRTASTEFAAINPDAPHPPEPEEVHIQFVAKS